MRRNDIIILLAAGGVVAVLFILSTRKTLNEGRRTSLLIAEPARTYSTSVLPNETRGEDPQSQFELTLVALRGIKNASESQQILGNLRAYLSSLPPEIASAAITDFLGDLAGDAATQIGFSVGKSGFLDGHPTLRVALLDWLGQIDPIQAAAIAERVLRTPTHPDEWAVCLRDYARVHADLESRDFLRTKTEELIRNPTWLKNPSVGYLEAFDVLVHAHATESSVLLGNLVRDSTPEGKVIAHAAYLTLDRLTICEPAAMMKQLVSQRALTKVRGELVADMFARADLRNYEQRQLVRDYLLDPDRTSAELANFAGVYPNANFVISKNLLTEIRTPTAREIIDHDSAAIEIIKIWLREPGFQPVKPYLITIHNRLATFVSQVSR
jgi:hypothetical protein